MKSNRRFYLLSFALLAVLALLWFFPGLGRGKTLRARVIVHPFLWWSELKRQRDFQKKVEKLMEGANQPIEFYGKIVDQDGNTIPGVRIQPRFESNLVTHFGKNIKSDPDGRFSVSGYKGSELWFNLDKRGYRYASTNGNAVYSLLRPPSERYLPDAAQPKVIKMWRESGPEPLVTFSYILKIPADQNVARIDLLRGEIVTNGGDIKVTFKRAPGADTPRRRVEWGYTVEAVEGGMRRSNLGEFHTTFLAPSEGLLSEFTQSFPDAKGYWNGNGSDWLFLTSRNGQVNSKFILICDINLELDSPRLIFINGGVANPNHSRNLEVYPANARPTSSQ